MAVHVARISSFSRPVSPVAGSGTSPDIFFSCLLAVASVAAAAVGGDGDAGADAVAVVPLFLEKESRVDDC